VAYLTDLQARGIEVYEDRGSFVIPLSPTDELHLSAHTSGVCHIGHQSAKGPNAMAVAVENLHQLGEYVSGVLTRFKKGPGHQDTTVRLKLGEPASNHGRIAKLIGSSKVDAIYDPYLDDKGLDTFRTIVRLSGASAAGLRILTTDKGARRLSHSFANAVFTELGQPGTVRKTSDEAHRRFMLLSGGKSLILGMSLNSIDKNEAAHIEDDREDRPFFDSEWQKGRPLDE
jgi:hypothetical protein